jgi:hypothetical protein
MSRTLSHGIYHRRLLRLPNDVGNIRREVLDYMTRRVRNVLLDDLEPTAEPLESAHVHTIVDAAIRVHSPGVE